MKTRLKNVVGRMRACSSAIFALSLLLAALAGCGGPPPLMPTPNLYVDGTANPYLDVEPTLRNNKVEVIYLTDRVPENDSPDKRKYGYHRSRSMAYGVSTVQFGENVSWNDLVAASRSRRRKVDLAMTVQKISELGRFQPTPRHLVETMGVEGAQIAEDNQRAVEEAFRKKMSERLAHTRVKEAYVFVHGFANTFDDSMTTIAELWHFFGREGVPVAYTWPAGSAGLLRGYNYDRESSEFTVYHLKQAIKLIASCPDIKKINIIGHSRGTDVVTSAIRELHLEIAGAGGDVMATRNALKLGTIVLAAPDIDVDVMIQRMATARVGYVPERAIVYVQENDTALDLANWLFSGMNRMGELKSTLFSVGELNALRQRESPQIIQARVSDTGAFGHDYFHSNPAVSSDLILAVRYELRPGAEYGRPLGVTENGFWLIEDGYPKTVKNKEAPAK